MDNEEFMTREQLMAIFDKHPGAHIIGINEQGESYVDYEAIAFIERIDKMLGPKRSPAERRQLAADENQTQSQD